VTTLGQVHGSPRRAAGCRQRVALGEVARGVRRRPSRVDLSQPRRAALQALRSTAQSARSTVRSRRGASLSYVLL
jgi:hypothetical protein